MSLRCSKCGNVALGFASEGDRCFSGKGRNRCNGLLLAFEDAPQKKPVEVPAPTVPEQPAVPVLVEVESHALPEANGYHDVDELVDAAPVSLDGPLADRRAAVKLARQVMEDRKAGKVPSAETLETIRSLFRDLGSIYRPERGFPDMARAREKHRGQFFTSTAVGRLIWDLACPPDGVRVLESSIGSANLIPYPDRCFVTGIDVDRESVIVSRALLGPNHCVIVDELQHHKFREQFDVVVGNPPYSVSVRDRAKLWARSVGWDGWGRAELVWLEQAALAVTKPGLVAAVLPVGVYETMTPRFVDWLEGHMHLVAEVILPRREAHVFSQWPVSLYLWVAGAPRSETITLECPSLSGWLDSPEAQDLRGRLGRLLEGLCPKKHEGPLVIRPYQPVKEKRAGDAVLPEAEVDHVLVRVVNGRLKLVPNGLGAQAKLALIRLEMGERYDRKQEKHIWEWDELLQGPALLSIGKVMYRLWLYGVGADVDGPSRRWLVRRHKWFKRQVANVPRWVFRKKVAVEAGSVVPFRRCSQGCGQ